MRQRWTTHDGSMLALPEGARVHHVRLNLVGTVTGTHRYDELEEIGVHFDGRPEGSLTVVKTKNLRRLAMPHGSA